MKCPSCNQVASSFLRNSFSLQGVTFPQSLRGQLRCQHCGTLLRNVRYGKLLWLALAAFALSFALIILLSDRLYRSIGIPAVAIYWVLLIILVMTIFVYGMWRFAILEKVGNDQATNP